MDRTGKCLCGAVRYTAKGVKPELSACHCGMCRRWAGGPLISVSCDSVEWQHEGSLQTLQTSAWAERGFCSKCGSAMLYRITAEGAMQGLTTVLLGTLDDQSGLTITREWFIDLKPDGYSFEGDHETLTQAETEAMFADA